MTDEHHSRRRRARALLDTVREGREAHIADAAARLAYELVADWLDIKHMKATQYPGSDHVHAAEAMGYVIGRAD